jgi:hypothetical protein
MQRALQIAEQIQKLEEEFAAILNGGPETSAAPAASASRVPGNAQKGKRVVSAETRAKMAAAQQARRARVSGNGAGTARGAASKPAGKRVLSPQGRARIVAGLKAPPAAAKKNRAGKK